MRTIVRRRDDRPRASGRLPDGRGSGTAGCATGAGAEPSAGGRARAGTLAACRDGRRRRRPRAGGPRPVGRGPGRYPAGVPPPAAPMFRMIAPRSAGPGRLSRCARGVAAFAAVLALPLFAPRGRPDRNRTRLRPADRRSLRRTRQRPRRVHAARRRLRIGLGGRAAVRQSGRVRYRSPRPRLRLRDLPAEGGRGGQPQSYGLAAGGPLRHDRRGPRRLYAGLRRRRRRPLHRGAGPHPPGDRRRRRRPRRRLHGLRRRVRLAADRHRRRRARPAGRPTFTTPASPTCGGSRTRTATASRTKSRSSPPATAWRFAFRGQRHARPDPSAPRRPACIWSIGDRGFHVPHSGRRFIAPAGHRGRVPQRTGRLEPRTVRHGIAEPRRNWAFDDAGNLFTWDNNSDSGDKARWVHVIQRSDSGWRMYFQYLDDRGPWNREMMWVPRDAPGEREVRGHGRARGHRRRDDPAGLYAPPAGEHRRRAQRADLRPGAWGCRGSSAGTSSPAISAARPATAGCGTGPTSASGATFKPVDLGQYIWGRAGHRRRLRPGRQPVRLRLGHRLGSARGRAGSIRFAQTDHPADESAALLAAGFEDLEDSPPWSNCSSTPTAGCGSKRNWNWRGGTRPIRY